MLSIQVFIALCVLLFIGKIIRIHVPLLQKMYLPSSVIGGIVGLIVLSTCGQFFDPQFADTIRKVPGFMINVVFATLFLGTVTPNLRSVFKIALPQLCLGQIMAWGQYVVGLALAGFVLSKFCDVPPAFGNLLEIGFEGGHGTVGGMKASFDQYWPAATDLGLTVATAGMIIGIVVGMALVNWAHRRGIVREVVPFETRKHNERRGIHLRLRRPDAGRQTVMCDSIDSLAWHVAIVGLATLAGYGLLQLIMLTGFRGFPLFPLCMIGGMLMQFLASKAGKDLLIDRGQMERISGASLDFLVVAAVATIRLDVVLQNWLALVLLITAGAAWSIFVVLYFAPRIFKEAWFERAIADFGQATGVTATGLLLLRTVDPENRTCAAASFGYKQLFHEPIMGGGVWTALAFVLVYTWGWLPVLLVSAAMLVFWIVCARFLNRRDKNFD